MNNKNVLITGGARRLGRAMSLAVGKAGGNVIIHHGNSDAEAREVRDEILALGPQAHILQADFADINAGRNLIHRALEHGPLFAIVNSAAIFKKLDWSTTTLEEWHTHLQINLTTPFILSKHFAESLGDDATGRIINILDWRALRPRDDHFPYTISKAALAAMTKSLAVSLAPRVTVNGLALGALLPPSEESDDDPQEIVEQVPIGRWAVLNELEEALLFLLTGPAYITGEIIHLDGGRHLI